MVPTKRSATVMGAHRQIWFGVWWNVPAGLISLGAGLWLCSLQPTGIGVTASGGVIGVCFFFIERKGQRIATAGLRRSVSPASGKQRLAE